MKKFFSPLFLAMVIGLAYIYFGFVRGYTPEGARTIAEIECAHKTGKTFRECRKW